MDTLLDRFCRYVKVETTAVEDTKDYPSSPGQLVLGKMLADEMKELGLADVQVDKNGIVMGTIPGNVKGAPTVAWLSHMDTSPEASGKNVQPTIHKNYDGKDIVLPGDKSQVIRVAESEGLAELKGKTIITSDGTTLLGADDKAGVAIIMTTAAELLGNPKLKHGPIRVVFTCDEEVGRGCDKVDPKKINATCAYTLDGESAGELEEETFSADLATVTITGYNIHPGLATGKMVNSIRLAGQFLSRMPWHTMAPETTAKRVGFLHPYTIEGGVPEVKIRILLRSFVTAELKEQAKVLKNIAATIMTEFPKAKVDVAVKKQYRNMIEGLRKEPRAADLARDAIRKVGLEPVSRAIRGGTDGSRLTEMGLPTPNLFTGMHNFHSKLEYACLEEMELSVKVLLELARLWGKQK
ncbi:MAG TPA: peptidase T [Phycisphaerae bacterium]|nr:peptidase T [Phycisphaerae bacterium]HNU46544.1 peptidase T [Phycisphaerae bacterium]